MTVYLGHRHPCHPEPLQVLPAFVDLPYPFLLYSARPDPEKGRFSFLGADPFLRLEGRGERCRIVHRDGREEVRHGDPLRVLEDLLQTYRTEPHPAFPFVGGAVGFISYSLKWQALGIPPPPAPDRAPPDLWFGFYDRALVFDHFGGGVLPVATGLPLQNRASRAARARQDLCDLEARLGGAAEPSRSGPGLEFAPMVDYDRYAGMVARARDAIARGEVYQLNLTYRWSAAERLDPVSAFARLVGCSRTPFCAFLDAGAHTILSTSPERFLHWDGRRAESRPIKGTRPRGASAAEDRAHRTDLLASSKDRAENIMIVDLIRNDLGRVCRIGSVRVRRLADLESYSSVHHLVSTVEGIPRADASRSDLIRALFPGGSMTGAPKIRALELIDALEPEPRGIYSGCLGYLSFSGPMDLSIIIRTVISDRNGTHFHVGGAILADSRAETEHRETLAKADAIFRALGEGGARRSAQRRRTNRQREGKLLGGGPGCRVRT